jgi:hypothetical protein
MDGSIVTTLIAIYGAILSSIVFLWNLYRDLTNKGKLKVDCYIGGIIIPGGPRDETDYLILPHYKYWEKTYLGYSLWRQKQEKQFYDNSQKPAENVSAWGICSRMDRRFIVSQQEFALLVCHRFSGGNSQSRKTRDQEIG